VALLSACQAQPTPALPTLTATPTLIPSTSPTTTPLPTLSPDEVAIRAARQALNGAFAQRDFATLTKYHTYNASLAGPAMQAHDDGEIQDFFRSITDSRPDLILTFTPDLIQLNPVWELASENGTWHETWSESGALTTLDGTYTAMWHKTDANWLMQAELFVPLTCTDSSYCNQ